MAPIGTKKNHAVVWSKNINRNFSDEELDKFFSCVSNEKHLVCFKLQAYLGLRISEAVKVNISDIDFNRRKIRIYSEKTKQMDFLHLHDKVFESLKSTRGTVFPILCSISSKICSGFINSAGML